MSILGPDEGIDLIDPTAPQNTATKEYVDTKDGLVVVQHVLKSSDTMTGDLEMGGGAVTNLSNTLSQAATDAAPWGSTVQLVINAVNSLVDKAGNTMTGQLNIGGSRIVGLVAASDPTDASTTSFMLETAETLKDGMMSHDGTPSATMQVNLDLGGQLHHSHR